MNIYLKISLLFFFSPIFLSYSMEQESAVSQSETEQGQNISKENEKLNAIVQDKINSLLALEDKDHRGNDIVYLEDAIKDIFKSFDSYDDKDKEKLTKKFKFALNQLLPKLINIQASSLKLPCLTSLFNNNPKFNSFINLSETMDLEIENSEEIEFSHLPQEMIFQILDLAISQVLTEEITDFKELLNQETLNILIHKCFNHIKNFTNVCKQFYITKEILLQKLKNAIVSKMKMLNNLLSKCVIQGHYNIAEVLILSKKININKISNGCTPLIDAIKSNNSNKLKLIKLLLDNGADIEGKDKNGFTPLMRAILKSDIHLVKLILKYNPNLEAKDNADNTVLEIADICRKQQERRTSNSLKLRREKIFNLLKNKINGSKTSDQLL